MEQPEVLVQVSQWYTVRSHSSFCWWVQQEEEDISMRLVPTVWWDHEWLLPKDIKDWRSPKPLSWAKEASLSWYYASEWSWRENRDFCISRHCAGSSESEVQEVPRGATWHKTTEGSNGRRTDRHEGKDWWSSWQQSPCLPFYLSCGRWPIWQALERYLPLQWFV